MEILEKILGYALLAVFVLFVLACTIYKGRCRYCGADVWLWQRHGVDREWEMRRYSHVSNNVEPYYHRHCHKGAAETVKDVSSR